MSKLIIPDEATPRLYGRLTLLFGGFLLGLGVYMGATLAITPLIEPMAEWSTNWVGQVYETTVIRRLDALTLDLANAKTPAEAKVVKDRITNVLSQPPPTVSMKVGMGGMQSPLVRNFSLVDTFIGFGLNVAMIVGAAGLVGLREWGRKTVVIVAAVKIAKLAVMSVLAVVWILPIQMKAMREGLEPLMRNQPKGAPVGSLTGEMLAAVSMGSTLIWLLLASIYPILLLVMLSKRRVRAACRSASYHGRDQLA